MQSKSPIIEDDGINEFPFLRNDTPVSPTKALMSQNLFKKQSKVDKLKNITRKPFQTRTNVENKTLHDYIFKHNIFDTFQWEMDKDFIKSIMKTARIEEVSKNRLICQEGDPIDYAFIIIQGRVGIAKDLDPLKEEIVIDLKKEEVFEHLLSIARKQIKYAEKMKKLRLKRRISFNVTEQLLEVENFNFVNSKDYFFEQELTRGDQYGAKQICVSRNQMKNIVTLETSIFLFINIRQLFHWLNHFFELKLAKSYEMLRKIPCFSNIEQQQLEQIIQSTVVKKKKKNEAIFKQGCQVHSIFLLKQGEIKIIKNANLFIDNPNQFYVDRRKLITTEQLKQNKQFLPYADLSHVYNYRPIQKNIELGLISPICLFGEEQVIEMKKREVNAICSSLECTYYEIQIKRIQEILTTQYDDFIDSLAFSAKDKIIYRQNIFAGTINIENKNKMDYFYFQGQSCKPSPRKFTLQKINKSFLTIQHKNQIQLDGTLEQKISSSQILQNKSVPPYYNTFNFDKLIKKQKDKIKFNIKSKTRSSKNNEQSSTDSDRPKGQLKNLMQEKIVANSHTWKQVKRKVKQQEEVSKKISISRHVISIDKPLIDKNFFLTIDQATRKLERERRVPNIKPKSKSKKR